MSPEERIAGLGLTLPHPWRPGASLEMATREGDLLYLAGHMGIDMARRVSFHGIPDHNPLVAGVIGQDISLEAGLAIARGGALNLVATLKDVLGDLDRVRQFLRVTVFVRAAVDLDDIHKVADAASDQLIDIFGTAGRHARTTVGATTLPGGSCVAIEATVSVN